MAGLLAWLIIFIGVRIFWASLFISHIYVLPAYYTELYLARLTLMQFSAAAQQSIHLNGLLYLRETQEMVPEPSPKLQLHRKRMVLVDAIKN